jgi:hypothetical protein
MLQNFYHQKIRAFGMWMDNDDGSECAAWKELTDVPRGAADDGAGTKPE